ncbi:MAG TPA: hypothetical protein VM450_17945 [Thermomicrobiales bacterium]|nr:hypothetical protein [Thermomicrobiales bacterium]
MRLDRALADPEIVGDLLIGVPLHEEPQHLHLTRREGLDLGAAGRDPVPREPPQETHGHGGLQRGLASQHAPDRAQQVAPGRVLEHIAGGAGPDGPEQVILLLVKRDDHDAGVG